MRLKAILPNFSSFVSASAGTGKTKTLIDRLVNLLLTEVKPNKILCLTFTKAAAAEILNRINQRLAEFSTCDRSMLIKYLNELGHNKISSELEYKARILFTEFVDSTESLNIQTIHAFCQQLLLKFPLEAGINLNADLLDDSKASALIEQAKNIILSSPEEYPGSSEAISYLSWHLKEYSLQELLTEIIFNREKLDHFFTIHQDIDLELPESEEFFIKDFIKHIPIKEEHINILNQGLKTDISKAKQLSKFLSYSNNLKIMFIQEYLGCFLTNTGDLRKSLLNKKLTEEFSDFFNLLIHEQQRSYQFHDNFKQIKTQRLTKAFTILSYYLRKIYQQLKNKNNSLDYDDLISLCYDLLNNSEYADWIRYKLDGGIDHILVDEAQDTSASQWNLINKISEDFFYQTEIQKSLFIVGDAKQSIFGFQGANPELFNAMNLHLPDEILRVQLNTSFRSSKKVLEFVDNIFNKPNIRPLVTNIEPNISHLLHKDIEGNITIWDLVLEPKKEKQQPWLLPKDFLEDDTIGASKQLAKNIANQIKDWIDSKKFIASKNRSIEPQDILILTRRRNDSVNDIIQELRELKIPVAGIDRLKLLNHPIILDIIALSNFLLCPSDDMSLAIILKSPIAKLSEDELLELCHNRDGTLWEAISKSHEHQDIYIFLKELNPSSLFEFYFELIEYKNLREIFIKSFGLEANDVLDSFLDLVSKFTQDNISSLQLFINFINNSKVEIKRDLSQDDQQVQIMTVHGAKGLQAPIVILTDTTSLPFNDDSIIWINEQELLWPGKTKYYSDLAKETKEKKLNQEYAEYLRLLYVALTRAEDELVITATAKTQDISPKCWYSIINNIYH